jgi:ABC-type sulfate/molybdate transport systems ATPase subunit
MCWRSAGCAVLEALDTAAAANALDAHVVKLRSRFTVDVAVLVEAGAACAIFGASGAGKSTVLGCIAGVETPDGGHIRAGSLSLFPPPLPLHLRPIGYLTQDANLFPHLSVAGNVRFGLSGGGANGAGGSGGSGRAARNGTRVDDDAWLAELRERLHIDSIWNESAGTISGGQARRVAFARMLARKPSLVLLDEPFTGLDRHLVRDLIAAIAGWQRRLGFTMLVVDHEAEVLERLCPRAIVIEEGRVVQDGTWRELRAAPATLLLAELLAPL